jgi:hypothetical protein
MISGFSLKFLACSQLDKLADFRRLFVLYGLLRARLSVAQLLAVGRRW